MEKEKEVFRKYRPQMLRLSRKLESLRQLVKQREQQFAILLAHEKQQREQLIIELHETRQMRDQKLSSTTPPNRSLERHSSSSPAKARQNTPQDSGLPLLVPKSTRSSLFVTKLTNKNGKKGWICSPFGFSRNGTQNPSRIQAQPATISKKNAKVAHLSSGTHSERVQEAVADIRRSSQGGGNVM